MPNKTTESEEVPGIASNESEALMQAPPPHDDIAAEAMLNFQRGGEEREIDPMMQAIQQELGQKLAPTDEGMKQADQMIAPYHEGEVFRAVNLTKAYGQGAAYNEVIKGISFTVEQGEYVVICGPSGSGKSTLLHMLAGLERPTRGEIRIRNTSFTQFTPDEIALYHREGVGLVFQSFNLLETLRVWENVAFPLMLAGAPVDWRQHESLKMLERFGLADFAGHYPNQLSGGQQQRVSLARALIHDPALLLIDEPTGNLDTKSADNVIKEISRLHKEEGRTIILVTHSQTFLPYATRVFYIRDGTLLASNEQNSIDTV
jgi:putative ABC transport system ATP-binding protein